MGVWACECVFCGGMSDAMGSKHRCKTFFDRVFRLTDPVEKADFFDWIPQSVGKLNFKKLSRKSPFLTVCKKARFWLLQSKTAVFDLEIRLYCAVARNGCGITLSVVARKQIGGLVFYIAVCMGDCFLYIYPLDIRTRYFL